MTVRVPLSVPDLRGRERDLLLGCVERNWVSSAGPEVESFEAACAKLTGRAHAVAVVNGTAALHLSLLACGVRPGNRVIVPDWTFAASANAVCHAGATPFFVDVSPNDWALCPSLTDDVLVTDTGIKAVIAVDPIGHAADFDALTEVSRKHCVPLIEDAAGAIGAYYGRRPCGSLADISIFSFNGNKTVTAGGGGMVLTNDHEKARLIRHLSTQARPSREYVHDQVGYNYRMTNVNAAIGLAQMERLSEMVDAKRAIAARYDAVLAGRTDVIAMPRPSHSKSSCWLYSVRLASEEDAQALVARLDDDGIESRIFWRSLSRQAPWQDAPRKLSGVASGLSGTVVSLPSSSSLREGEQQRVIDALHKWRGRELLAA